MESKCAVIIVMGCELIATTLAAGISNKIEDILIYSKHQL